MSYLTIDIDGEPQEITDIGKVYGRKEYGDKFIEALETRISENREAGRAPLDGIDFPDGSKQHDVSLWSWGSLMMANRLNKSEVFIKALEDQCKGKNDPKEALDFIGKLDLSSVLRESDGVKKDLLKVLYDRTLEEKTKLTASTATWAMAYASKHDLSGNFGYFSEDVTRFEDNGEKLEENAVKALDVVLKGGRGNGLHHMAGVLERSDLSSLDNKAKESIEDVVQSKVKDFTEQSLVTNLSEKAFLKRKNITLEDVQAYYDKDKRLSEIDLLNEIDSAKENNGIENYTEAMNKVRGELAVKYVMETEQVNYSVVNKFSKDICQGFKDNAEALKKLGVAIPSSVMDVLKKDEQLKDDIKFIDESRSFINFDVGQDNKVELLNQVTEKGFSAGYGVELLVLESGKALETNRKTYEERKKRLEKGLNEREQYNQTKERYEILEEIIRSTNIDGLSEMGLNQDDILKMALDKVTGKNVKDMEAPKQTSGVERWFMGGKAKAKEKADIEAKQKACNNINNFVKEFSAKFEKVDTKFADNNPVALLKKYSSLDEISEQLNKDGLSKKEYHEYFSEREDRAFIENFEKMEKAYKTAQAKLDSQVAITKVARETSGVKDIETNTGFDAMATKAQIREKNPNMKVRELYATMKEIRDKGEYSPEIKVKEPDKVPTLRGIKSPEKQHVKQTTLPHPSMRNRSNSNG